MALKKPKTKAEFFALENETWEAFESLVADLPKSALTQPGAAGDWSIKDVWAHLATWMKQTQSLMPLLLKGEKVPANIQAFNAEQSEKFRKLSLAAARQNVERERKKILALIQKIPDEQLLKNSRVYSWASFSTYNHYHEHIPAVTQFARKRKRECAPQD